MFERIEVTIAMQKRMTVHEAKCGNPAVNGLADGVATLPKLPKIPCGGDGDVLSAGVKNLKFTELAQHLREGFFVLDRLKRLAKNDVCKAKTVAGELAIKVFRFGGLVSTQIVDPNGGIDDHHGQLFRVAPETRFSQIANATNLAATSANRGLCMDLDEQPQTGFHGRPFRAGTASFHRLAHEPVIDVDVSTHWFASDV
jgi:hypothetical protein